MNDLGMLWLWKINIFLLIWTLIVFVLMEFSLDEQKREEDGTLRVKKKGFVIRWIFNNFLSSDFFEGERKYPKSLCQLFWGIWSGGVFNLLVIWAFYVCFFQVAPIFFKETSLKIGTVGFWLFIKYALIATGCAVVMVAIIGLIFFLVDFSEGKIMPATKDWFISKKKKICPMIKLVD